MQKIRDFFGYKAKKQFSLHELLTPESTPEKEAFLGRIIERVNEDQRDVIEKAKQIKTSAS